MTRPTLAPLAWGALAALALTAACGGSTRLPPGEYLEAGDPAPDTMVFLRPGDVLMLRRWSPGFQRLSETKGTNPMAPTAVSLRVPLRRVRPDGRLRSYERELLLTVLSANRSGLWNSFEHPHALADSLRSREVAVWNAFVENLVLREHLPPGGWRHDSTFVVSVFEDPLRAALGAELRDILREDGAMTDRPDWQKRRPVLDLFGVRKPFNSPEQALLGDTEFDDWPNPNYYGTAELQPALFAFQSVELDGVRIFGDGPEQAWTLREWAHSGVCTQVRDDTAIVALRLRGAPGRFVIVASGTAAAPRPPATHDIERSRTGGRAVRELVARRPRWHRPPNTLPDSALAKLTMADLAEIEWARPDEPPSNCRLPSRRRPR